MKFAPSHIAIQYQVNGCRFSSDSLTHKLRSSHSKTIPSQSQKTVSQRMGKLGILQKKIKKT